MLLLLLGCAPVGLLLLRPLPAACAKQLPQPRRRRRRRRLLAVLSGSVRPVTAVPGHVRCFRCRCRFRMPKPCAACRQAPRQLLPAARLPRPVLLQLGL